MPWAIIAAVMSVAFVSGAAVSWFQATHQDPSAVEGLLWPDPPVVAPVNLVDQNGLPFTLDRLRGRWSLLFFGFTTCPDVCPTSLDVLARAHEELKTHERYGDLGQVVFVSVDPERDTPESIGSYVEFFHPDFVGVTASVEELKDFSRSLGALFMKVPQGGNAYTLDHSAGVFIIDPELQLVSVMTPPHAVAAVVKRFDGVSTWLESNRQ